MNLGHRGLNYYGMDYDDIFMAWKTEDGDIAVIEHDYDSEGYCKLCYKIGVDTYLEPPKPHRDKDGNLRELTL